MLDFLNNIIVASIIKSAIIIVALLTVFAYLTLIERRVLAKIQGRLGPNRTGPFGAFQPIADGIKMAFKEQFIPGNAKKFIFIIAPIISMIIAISAFAVIPIGGSWLHNKPSVWDPWIADINVGILWILSISSLAVYGIVLGGWSSGNRYSLLGALRSAAQMVSYETSLGLALSGVLMWSQTLSLLGIVRSQIDLHTWYILVQPLGFMIYMVAACAEVNRAPFDLPEAEQELTAGYLTEYSGLRWSLYQMSEYINMITTSFVAATLFFGGWALFGLENIPVLSILIYIVKVAFFLFLFIWVRATLPRIRYDRLMRLGWQVLLPLAVLNIVITAVIVALHWSWWINFGIEVVIIAIIFLVIRQRSFTDGTRFTEKAGEVATMMPTSVHLAKFVSVNAPAAEPVVEEQEQDADKVQV
jgi:NADH-quinone oxidoreductase subunit H